VIYIFKNGAGNFSGQDAAAVNAEFNALLASPPQLILWHGVFMAIAAFILVRGVQKGIERSVKILMPVLFALLLAMVLYGAIEGDMPRALAFMFSFDFSAIDGNTILVARGPGLFLDRRGHGPDDGLRRLPAAGHLHPALGGHHRRRGYRWWRWSPGWRFSPSCSPTASIRPRGPGLIFVSLPIAFGNVPGGLVFGTLFFILLLFAALTSVIGCLEPMIAWWEERFQMIRWKAAVMVSTSVFVLGIGTVFSFNLWSAWRPLSFIERFADFGYFEILDYVTANLMMPIGGLLLALFVGWRIRPEDISQELQMRHPALFRIWFWLLRWLVPLSIAGILYSVI
jgi:neurotransmitter:Na+ symporter, NSS family